MLLSVASILAAVLVGAASPGPSFLLVARISVARSRRDGLAAALGMGMGGAAWAALALAGLRAAIAQAPWLHAGLQAAGGAYLLYLAWGMARGAGKPLGGGSAPAASSGHGRSFLAGLATQVGNPKTAAVYAGIFAALLPAQPPGWLPLALLPGILLVEAGWYALVALAFSSGAPRAAYLRGKHWLDRLAAGIMGLLGLRLMADALTRSKFSTWDAS